MKNLFLLCCVCIALLVPAFGKAQSFTVAHDTMLITASAPTVNIIDSVINLAAATVSIQWKVVATNFPADWQAGCASAFCDPNLCYGGPSLWPSAASTQTFSFGPGGNDFNLTLFSPCATSYGCYYVTVRMNNAAIPTDTATETFLVCKPTPSCILRASAPGDITLYPNPATNALNIVYDADADIKTIAVYNVIGKAVRVYKATTAGSANLDLTGIPPGIYLTRLVNSRGDAVATRRFTKQ